MATRERNERRYHHWEELPGGGRRYWKLRPGGDFGWQRMVKVVDENEVTIRIVQEILDDNGDLIESHQKFPRDTGHFVHGAE
ncbi:MAG: hypothetical protein OXF44_02770 [Anaerolineaceae bacterium]|nr:hypothetical protein [Anaerolineaceae bacterium]MCY4022154.1 hypothetical protein [Anaerolineaceae bacterium]